ncbi:MAG TPA: thioredoxin-disulfide reductase [Stellaceae bacterium]|jgi:thioredoxin reductase (NADPH)|nr:thioredoxin-disulfide reductase [Stellaceae bacterium]
MTQRHHTKFLIIGSGPAGYTAAIYAARANLQPILVQGLQPGGQLTITTDVENYPGFAQVIQGPWLMEEMQRQAEHVGTRLITDLIVEADISRRPFTCIGDSGDVYVSDTLAICTGAQARWLDLPSEATFRGFGVSACATCDGFFFRNKEVVVVGGGNTAVEEALYLTNHATRVTLIHRRDQLRAEKILQARLFANPKIRVVWDSVVEEILGEREPPRVTGVRVLNVKTGAQSVVACDGFFVAIGHTPVTELFRGQLALDADGYILTRADSTATDVPGVFAAGDVKDKIFRQAVTAAGMGCMAALEAEKLLAAEEAAAAMNAAE